MSVDDFRVIRDNLAGGSRTMRGRLIPYCLFTPPLARVGLNEAEARRRGVVVRVAKLPVAAVLRTRTRGDARLHFALSASSFSWSDMVVSLSKE